MISHLISYFANLHLANNNKYQYINTRITITNNNTKSNESIEFTWLSVVSQVV